MLSLVSPSVSDAGEMMRVIAIALVVIVIVVVGIAELETELCPRRTNNTSHTDHNRIAKPY